MSVSIVNNEFFVNYKFSIDFQLNIYYNDYS